MEGGGEIISPWFRGAKHAHGGGGQLRGVDLVRLVPGLYPCRTGVQSSVGGIRLETTFGDYMAIKFMAWLGWLGESMACGQKFIGEEGI